MGRQTGNIRDLEDFAKLSVSLKVDFAQYRPFHWDNTFYQVIPDLVDIAERLSGAITTINFSSHKIGNDYRHYSVCYGANFATVIGADANVYLCCHLRGQQRYAIGNLRRESLLTVWSRRQSVIEKVKVAGCMPQCRCHAVNQVVQDVVDNQKLAVLQNLSGYIVVESDNVLLICKKEDEQKIRQFVADISLKHGEEFI